MARDKTILGIDLNDSELRVVQVRYRGNKAFIEKAQAAPMPSDAMVSDRVINAGSVAIALRRLIDSMHIGSGGHAVVGICGGTVLRTISIPPVPEAEISAVVATEIEHQELLHTPNSAFAFLRLWSPHRIAQEPASVAVIGVEEDTTSKLRYAVERADLVVEAFEPTQYGMFRAAMVAGNSSATVFALLVGGGSTEVAFVHEGQIIAYRRLDTGSRALLSTAHEAVVSGNIFAQVPPGPTETKTPEEAPPGISLTALDTLGTDVYRTLDYFHREFPEFSVVDRIHIVVDDPRLAPLDVELGKRLGIATELVRPVTEPGSVSPDLDLTGDEGLRYAAAFGLAMWVSPDLLGKVPRIDLFSKERSTARQQDTQRNFAGSIAVSLTALVLGVAGYYLYNSQITEASRLALADQTEASVIRSQTSSILAERAKRADQYRALRKEGVPIGPIMDYLVGSLEPGVGVASVNVDTNLKVVINGEAIDEPALIKTVQTLQRSPLLSGLIIDSFSRSASSTGITFQLSAMTVPMSRIKLPPSAPKETR